MSDLQSITADELRARGSVKWSDGGHVLGAWVAEMDYGTAPSVLAAWDESARLREFGYAPQALAREMSEATAEWYRAVYGWAVPADDIAPIADVIKGLELAILEFSAPGGAVIVPTPAYMPFLSVPPSLGREVIEVPMLPDADGTLRLDLETMRGHLAAGANLIILANPGNPTGRVFSRDELLALGEVADEYDARVFSDEIHAPLTLFGTTHVPFASVSAAAARAAVTATSASKAWNLPGLKCAQLILSNDADRERWLQIGPMASHGASTPGIRANTAAYRAGEPWLREVIGMIEGNYAMLRDGLTTSLPKARVAPLEGTYLAWLDLTAYPVEGEVGAYLLENAGVRFSSGPAFGVGYDGFVRVNLATTRPILAEIIERMGTALGSSLAGEA